MVDENNIRKHALFNASKFNGKANPGSVIGALISENPDIKKELKDLNPKIMKIISEVNSMSVEEQMKELENKFPEMLEEKEVEEKSIFAFLNIPEGAKVRTAFPPGPEKYPHIGHAKASLLNYELAKEYGGEFYLRFEDTNPNLVKEEFYNIIQENLKWLGVKWHKLVYASDHMDLYYEFIEKLLKSGDAYVCTCSAEEMSESRKTGKACACRNNSSDENLKFWEGMKKDAKEGSMAVRLKIDLEHKNSTMRDPTVFRIIEKSHARHGNKYRVWPNYDFQNAVMDGYFEITHRLRSKEFEMRSELQTYIQKSLDLYNTTTYEFARFNIKDAETSGRIIREKIENGELTGWDDPSLVTIVALRKRGFLPEAIKSFVLSTGISKSESTLEWSDFILHNKRLLDKTADRYFFIKNPKKIFIENAPNQDVELNLHPENKKGGRKFKTGNEFYVSEEDFNKFEDEKLYRFMDCLNFVNKNDKFVFHSLNYENYKKEGARIMHWLPVSDDLVKVEILHPDKTISEGLAEKNINNLNVGDVIQFERFGFCRYDSNIGDKKVFYFTHK